MEEGCVVSQWPFYFVAIVLSVEVTPRSSPIALSTLTSGKDAAATVLRNKTRTVTVDLFACASTMVSSCCVRHCHNRRDCERDKRFFSIPFVVNGKGQNTREITARPEDEGENGWLNSDWKTSPLSHGLGDTYAPIILSMVSKHTLIHLT